MATEPTVKKTYNLPQRLVSRAQQILGAKTETETIVRTLREVVFFDEVEKAVHAVGGKFPDFARRR